jgi:hypothetical protein
MGFEDILKDEIQNDPNARGYSGMTDAEIVDRLFVADVPMSITRVTGEQLVAATDAGDFGALSEPQRDLWRLLVSRASVDLTPDVWGRIESLWSGTNTLSAVETLRTRQVTTIEALGLPNIGEHHVKEARKAIRREAGEDVPDEPIVLNVKLPAELINLLPFTKEQKSDVFKTGSGDKVRVALPDLVSLLNDPSIDPTVYEAVHRELKGEVGIAKEDRGLSKDDLDIDDLSAAVEG